MLPFNLWACLCKTIPIILCQNSKGNLCGKRWSNIINQALLKSIQDVSVSWLQGLVTVLVQITCYFVLYRSLYYHLNCDIRCSLSGHGINYRLTKNFTLQVNVSLLFVIINTLHFIKGHLLFPRSPECWH